MPKELLVIGGRTYEMLDFMGNDTCIKLDEVARRAAEMNANLGKEDGKFLIAHRDEIPEELRNTVFIFPDWRPFRHEGDDEYLCFVFYDDKGRPSSFLRWVETGRSLWDDWQKKDNGRVLRRVV